MWVAPQIGQELGRRALEVSGWLPPDLWPTELQYFRFFFVYFYRDASFPSALLLRGFSAFSCWREGLVYRFVNRR